MKRAKFTKKEEVVFYGMVAHPEMNDHELSVLLDEKISTITSIRRRLRARGFFRRLRLPLLHNMGCEIVVITNGRFTPKPRNLKLLENLKDTLPTMFYSICGTYDCLSIGAARDFTTARRNLDSITTRKEFYQIIDERTWNMNYLPYSALSGFTFFDLEPMMRRAFDLGTDDPLYKKVGATRELADLKKMMTPREGMDTLRRMTRIERKVFMGLIENPEIPDKSLADIIKVSRQAVSKMRKKFEGMGLLKNVVVPDLDKLELNIVIFTYHKLRECLKEKERASIVKRLGSRVPYFLLFATESEIFGVTALRSYEDFDDAIGEFNSYIEKRGLAVSMPMAVPFSTKDLKHLNQFNFVPLVKSLLGG